VAFQMSLVANGCVCDEHTTCGSMRRIFVEFLSYHRLRQNVFFFFFFFFFRAPPPHITILFLFVFLLFQK
jgi:hypothetical protein